MKNALILGLLVVLCYGCASLEVVGTHETEVEPEFSEAESVTYRALEESLQCMVVVTNGWDDVDGRLWRYERTSQDAPWTRLSPEYAIVVGRSGLAWGRGEHPMPDGDALVKREGDGRSPAGVFGIPSAFGFASPGSLPGIKLPYDHVTDGLMCVDDGASKHYNRIVHTNDTSKDWNSAEDMYAIGEDYNWGIVVAHNLDPIVPGGGSCIFIHNWRGAGNGTAGCTAMEPQEMQALMTWVDPIAEPLLVQLPLQEYTRLQAEWGLPVIDETALP